MPDRFQSKIYDQDFCDNAEFEDPKGVGGFLYFYMMFMAAVAIGLYVVINLAVLDMEAGYVSQTIFDKLYIPLACTVAVSGVASVVFLYLKNRIFFISFGITAVFDIIFEAFIKPFSYYSLIEKKWMVLKFDFAIAVPDFIFMVMIFAFWVVYFILSVRIKDIFCFGGDKF